MERQGPGGTRFAADRVIAFSYSLLALALSTVGVLVVSPLAGRRAATMSDNERW